MIGPRDQRTESVLLSGSSPGPEHPIYQRCSEEGKEGSALGKTGPGLRSKSPNPTFYPMYSPPLFSNFRFIFLDQIHFREEILLLFLFLFF